MNKILRYFLFSCALIFNANLVYSKPTTTTSTTAEKINYLKRYSGIFPQITKLTDSSTTDEVVKVVSSQNSNGETLLQLVSGLDEFQSEKGGKHLKDIKGDLKAVKYLIRLGVDPNIRDERGTTPLMIAALTGRLDIVEYLLTHGAHKSLMNKCYSKDSAQDKAKNLDKLNFCSTALDYAKESLERRASDSGVAERLRIIIELLTSEPVTGIKVPLIPTKVSTDKESEQLLEQLDSLRNRALSFVFNASKFPNPNLTAINESIEHKYHEDIYDLVNYIDEAEITFAESRNKAQLKTAITNASNTMDFLDKVNGSVAARNTYAQQKFVLMTFLAPKMKSPPSYISAINDIAAPSAPSKGDLPPSYDQSIKARG